MFGANAVAHNRFAVLPAHLLSYGWDKPSGFGIFKQGAQVSSLEIGGRVPAAVISGGSVDIDPFDLPGWDSRSDCFWQNDNETDADAIFEEKLSLPLSMIAP